MSRIERITHIITTIEVGGAEKQLLELVGEQRRSGIDVEVIYLKGIPSLSAAFSSMGVLVNSSFVGLNFFYQIFLLKHKHKITGEVFHAHLPRAEVLSALALPKKKFIVSRHNEERFFPKAPTFISKILSRFVMSRAFGCIAISNAVRNFLISSGEIATGTLSTVIYYGTSNLHSILPRKSPSNNRITVGTIARLVKQKNLPFLLDVFSRLLEDQSKDWHLVIVGEGPLEIELKNSLRSRNLDNHVSFMGKINHISDFYKTIDIFALTSDYEGFGLVLLEAMSFGVPVVARRKSAIPEVLGYTHPGLSSEESPKSMSEIIRKIISDESFRFRILESQNIQKEKFSIRTTCQRHSEFYLSLIRANSNTR